MKPKTPSADCSPDHKLVDFVKIRDEREYTRASGHVAELLDRLNFVDEQLEQLELERAALMTALADATERAAVKIIATVTISVSCM